jgi:hypothetical protein
MTGVARGSAAASWLSLTLLLACGGENTNNPATPSTLFSCPPRAKASLSGNVHDPAGRPVEGAQLSFLIIARTGGCGAAAAATTDADGNYGTSADIVDGYIVQVNKPGYNPFSRSGFSVRGDTAFDVTLEPGVTITGSVSESGVGALPGATVEVISGPNAGLKTTSNILANAGFYLLNVLPGDVGLRVSKPGYETVERVVPAAVSSNADFVLKWAYGTCLQSVTPVAFNDVSHDGWSGSASVVANAGRSWAAASDSAWLELLSPASQTGSGQVAFRVMPNGDASARSGALMIRCSATEGQNIWVIQNGDCRIALTPSPDTPSTFPADGGLGSLTVQPSASSCRWSARYGVEWIGLIGDYINRSGTATVRFQVLPNRTGAARAGSVIVGDVEWPVSQQ